MFFLKRNIREVQNINPTAQLLRVVGIGVLASLITMLILLTLVSFVFKATGTVSATPAGIVVVLVAALSGFTGGYVSTRILKRKGLLVGMITVLVVGFLVFVAGFFLSGNNIQPTNLIKQGVLIIGGCIGGVMGVNHRSKRK